jgi:hypothetical protein
MSQSPPSLSRSKLVGWCGPAAIVFLELMIYSAVQAPVPGVNEPQYLGKAAHFWDPSWAASDRFLESSNPHLVFYVAVGWLTTFLSLEATAWIARVAGYGLLAAGWTALASALTPSRWAAVISTALFLLCGSIGNLSGEWLVGGIEGKVFSYGLLFFAIACWLTERLLVSALCLGLAISFHPIVGVWGLICIVGADVSATFLFRKDAPRCSAMLLRSAAVLLLSALPGIVPAAATLGGASSKDAAIANYIQVFWRLRHHLDPTTFSLGRYAGYVAMFVAWLCVFLLMMRRQRVRGRAGNDSHRSDVRWLLFVSLAVLIAAIGVGIGWHGNSAWHMPLRNVRTALLKFYPFRLADVFVPLALSLLIARLTVERWRLPLRGVAIAGGIAAFVVAVAIPLPDRNPSRLPPERLTAWKDVAAWAEQHTPGGTVFVTPSRHWGFKWFAQRAEYVNFKDSPQDTAGLLEWKRRLDVLREWWASSDDGRYSQVDLERLGRETGAAYLITYAYPGRFGATPLYENEFYRVYALQ